MKLTVRIGTALASGALALAAVATVAFAGTVHKPNDGLAAVRHATAKYHSVARAEHAGYAQASPCEASPAGGMGHHYVNQALVMDPALDPRRPEILLYAPKRNGKLRLVGVEYFAVALANTPTGPASWFSTTPPPGGFFNPAPSLFGRTFDGPMAGHAPGMPWHYDLHVWVWKRNPSGMFAQWNPRVHCA